MSQQVSRSSEKAPVSLLIRFWREGNADAGFSQISQTSTEARIIQFANRVLNLMSRDDQSSCRTLLLASQAGPQSRDGATVQRLERQESVAVSLREGRVVRGKVEVAPSAIDVSSAKAVEQIARQDVSAVRVEKRGSRKERGALWGAIIGFATFPIAAAAAGNLTDRNNPSASTRIGIGAGFRAGIGAGVAGGFHTLMICRAP